MVEMLKIEFIYLIKKLWQMKLFSIFGGGGNILLYYTADYLKAMLSDF